MTERTAYYGPDDQPGVVSTVTGERLVTWTTPHMRAERAFMAAAEHLSFGKKAPALAKLRESIGHMRDLIAVLEKP